MISPIAVLRKPINAAAPARLTRAFQRRYIETSKITSENSGFEAPWSDERDVLHIYAAVRSDEGNKVDFFRGREFILMGNVRAHAIIEGLVQGVFFRAGTRDAALRHGVNGWVRNNPDGSVEAVFEGTVDAVDEIIRWCRVGPPGARVDAVRVDYLAPTGEFTDFTIERLGRA